MGKIIAIANQKGGVGKTTTAINLSTCLGMRGKKVLLLDSDPQGNASGGLGIDRDAAEATTYDCLINGVSIKDAAVTTPYRNLSICPANTNLAGAEPELVSVKNREFRLKEALRSVMDDYDFCIIDCPPSLGLVTLNALTAADSVLIPIQCEYYALEGLSQLTRTVKTVKKSLNPALQIEGIVLTMFDGRTNLSVQVKDEVRKYFGALVYDTIIPRNVRLSEAPSYGMPIVAFDAKSRGAECYRKLANELIRKQK